MMAQIGLKGLLMDKEVLMNRLNVIWKKIDGWKCFWATNALLFVEFVQPIMFPDGLPTIHSIDLNMVEKIVLAIFALTAVGHKAQKKMFAIKTNIIK